MPELPEVETVKTGLTPHLQGEVIANVLVRQPSLRYMIPEDFSNNLANKRVVGLRRRSKYLLLDLEDGNTAIIHLGMSGSFTIKKGEYTNLAKHDHVIFTLKNGDKIVYNDPRRFGLIDLVETDKIEASRYFKNLGPEPFSKSFNADYLHTQLKKRKASIKQVIMDSKVVVGVGNIYASESLFLAKINPTLPANKVSIKACSELIDIIRQTLQKAIDAGGSSLQDHRQADGTLGYFQHQFNVYGKKGEACKVCGTIIQQVTLGQRSTFYCPKCQKK